MAAGVQPLSSEAQATGPRSFIDYSAARVGQTWTEEDHAALLHHLAQVDELCIAIWKRMRNDEPESQDFRKSVA